MENARILQTFSHQKSWEAFDVPVQQVLSVHPVEHWNILGDTQDPWLHPWEQIAVKEVNKAVTELMNQSVNYLMCQ